MIEHAQTAADVRNNLAGDLAWRFALRYTGAREDRLHVRDVAAQIGEQIAILDRRSASRLPDAERWTRPIPVLCAHRGA